MANIIILIILCNVLHNIFYVTLPLALLRYNGKVSRDSSGVSSHLHQHLSGFLDFKENSGEDKRLMRILMFAKLTVMLDKLTL